MLKKTITYLESHLALAYGTEQPGHTRFYRCLVPMGQVFSPFPSLHFTMGYELGMCRRHKSSVDKNQIT